MKDSYIRRCRLYYILLKQFVQFCVEPNLKQIVKIDCVSKRLKAFFMDWDAKSKEYVVSFGKVLNIFSKLKEIHFFNWYILDNAALSKLILQIEQKTNTLRVVKFLYYDYEDPLDAHPYFKHPKHLDKKLVRRLEKLNWHIKYKENTNQTTGYTIKIYSKK